MGNEATGEGASEIYLSLTGREPWVPAPRCGFRGARSGAAGQSPTGGLRGLPGAGRGGGEPLPPQGRGYCFWAGGGHLNMGKEIRSLLSGPIWGECVSHPNASCRKTAASLCA